MSQYTPGPWHTTPEGHVSSDTHGFVPLRTPFREDAFREGPTRCDTSEPELLANARLIAKAPEMLALLRSCLLAIEDWGRSDYLPGPQIRALLREIEGEKP